MTISEAILRRREKQGWRCFHCDEIFHSEAKAALHFGKRLSGDAICKVDAASVRAMEEQLRRYREEDTDLRRQLSALQSQHQTDLRREEEKGYARGLSDGRKLRRDRK